MFNKILKSLIKGSIIEIVNDEYDYQAFWYCNGNYHYKYQNCFSDTCNCVSHDKYIIEIVPRKFILELLRENIDILEEIKILL